MRLFSSFFLLVAMLASPAASFSPQKEITPESVLREMNVQRRNAGLAPLIADPRMDLAAGDRMSEMEDAGSWGHVSPVHGSPFAWMGLRGYEHSHAGENLAQGFETAHVLVSAWMESPGHRRNILAVEYEHAGIAVIEGKTSGKSVGRSVVVLFARALR